MTNKYQDLDRVLDRDSYEWLADNAPPLSEAVTKAVAAGISPADIRRRVVDRLGAHRVALALRCEAAARWLKGSGTA